MDELWDIATVAAYLGVSERTVYNRVRAGELPAIKFGRLWRVRPGDLDSWLRAATPAQPQTAASLPGPYPYASERDLVGTVRETGAPPTRATLEALLAPLSDPLARRLAFVGLLSLACEELGWPAPV
ncbi:MAG: helix-turn-helix domain-containing protein, partial [Coriobacteriia bacterium]